MEWSLIAKRAKTLVWAVITGLVLLFGSLKDAAQYLLQAAGAVPTIDATTRLQITIIAIGVASLGILLWHLTRKPKQTTDIKSIREEAIREERNNKKVEIESETPDFESHLPLVGPTEKMGREIKEMAEAFMQSQISLGERVRKIQRLENSLNEHYKREIIPVITSWLGQSTVRSGHGDEYIDHHIRRAAAVYWLKKGRSWN